MLVENCPFEPTPLLFGAPIWGDSVGICWDFWHETTRLPWLSYGVVCVILNLAILVQCRLVTDGPTDRQTDGRTDTRQQHIPC